MIIQMNNTIKSTNKKIFHFTVCVDGYIYIYIFIPYIYMGGWLLKHKSYLHITYTHYAHVYIYIILMYLWSDIDWTRILIVNKFIYIFFFYIQNNLSLSFYLFSQFSIVLYLNLSSQDHSYYTIYSMYS